MKNNWKTISLIVGAILVGAVIFYFAEDGLSAVSTHDGSESSAANFRVGTAVGNQAPDFTGTTIDGETVQLSELKGKTVLVNVFASWCAPCIIETPHLVEAFNASNEDIVFIGVNLQESEAAVAGYQDEFNVTYPLVLDPKSEILNIYKPIGLPTSWFIDPDGIVRYVHAGAMTLDLIEGALEAAEAGERFDPFAPTPSG
jgi:peroxiredoxin